MYRRTLGYDIEDAVVLNKAALDRGYARAFIFKRLAIEKKSYANIMPVRASGCYSMGGGGHAE